jgi:hypothetical protein
MHEASPRAVFGPEERQLEFRHASGLDDPGWDPDQIVRIQDPHELSPREPGAGKVESAGEVVFDNESGETGKVPGIDELQVVGAIARRQHFPAASSPVDPAREAPAGVERACDNLRAQERGAICENVLDNVFASDLEAGIHLAIQVGRIFVGGRNTGVGFKNGTVNRIAVNSHSTDEDITMDAAAQEFHGRPDLTRRKTADVDAHIPATVAQGLIGFGADVTIAAEPFHLRREFVGRLAAIHNGYAVTNCQQGLHNVPAYKLRSAKDQNVHA